MSIKTNVKNITKTSVALPLETVSVALEVTNDLASTALAGVKGVVPVSKKLGSIVGHFTAGMLNADRTPEEVEAMLAEITLAKILEAAEKGAIKSGQEFAKGWD